MKITTVEEMKNLDIRAIKEFSIMDEILMENAGQAAYFVLLQEVGIRDKKFVVLCGTGNNGGDGLVVARKIHSSGGEPKVFILGEKNKFKGAAKKNFEITSKLPIKTKNLKSLKHLDSEISHCDVIVDGIFGTGLARDVEGVYKDVINLINKSGKQILSLDIPSGINGNTGRIMGTSVKSDYTIAFGLPKLGNMLYPGYENCGKLFVSHISFPPALYNTGSLKIETNRITKIPERKKNGHKGDFGDILFIAGSANYYGAPYFSALSFLKAGGGYSRLATPASLSPFLGSKGSEIVLAPQKETSSGSIALKNKEKILRLSEQVDMVVIGPGLSLNEETQELVRQLIKDITKPILIDGDGITAISKNTKIIERRESPTILTPHLGEMSRITDLSIDKIQENKIKILQKESKKLNVIIVLKGAHSLISYPDQRIFINISGNSGMASAGSGDVLTGTIAAMFGLGLPIEDAVKTGVFMHGLSGDLAAIDLGEDGITAQNIMDYLPITVKHYREKFVDISKNFNNSLFII